jgi:hypothetical protein
MTDTRSPSQIVKDADASQRDMAATMRADTLRMQAEAKARAEANRKRPSLDPTRHTASNGVANFTSPNDAPAEYVLDLIPGAEEAHDAWLVANTEGAEAYAAEKAARQALADARKTMHSHDVEIAEGEIVALEAKTRFATYRSKAALGAYDDLVTPRLADPAALALSAERALDADDRARAAFDELRSALAERALLIRRARLIVRGGVQRSFAASSALTEIDRFVSALDRRDAERVAAQIGA